MGTTLLVDRLEHVSIEVQESVFCNSHVVDLRRVRILKSSRMHTPQPSWFTMWSFVRRVCARQVSLELHIPRPRQAAVREVTAARSCLQQGHVGKATGAALSLGRLSPRRT